MNKMAAADAGGLTRTTLRLNQALTGSPLTALITSLQRVPGVLIAEANALGDRALLAHDGAVPIGALLAATATHGIRATVERDPNAPRLEAAPAVVAERPVARRVTIIGVGVFAVLGIVDAFVPAIRENHAVSIALIGSVWTFFLVDAYLNRRR
jgi:hypothetical protein